MTNENKSPTIIDVECPILNQKFIRERRNALRECLANSRFEIEKQNIMSPGLKAQVEYNPNGTITDVCCPEHYIEERHQEDCCHETGKLCLYRK